MQRVVTGWRGVEPCWRTVPLVSCKCVGHRNWFDSLSTHTSHFSSLSTHGHRRNAPYNFRPTPEKRTLTWFFGERWHFHAKFTRWLAGSLSEELTQTPSKRDDRCYASNISVVFPARWVHTSNIVDGVLQKHLQTDSWVYVLKVSVICVCCVFSSQISLLKFCLAFDSDP